MKTHELKTDTDVFKAVLDGLKTYEIRKNDRDYQVGDCLILKDTRYTGQEMANGKPLIYTGYEIHAEVTHILNGPCYGLVDGWCIMTIAVHGQKDAIKQNTIKRRIDDLGRVAIPKEIRRITGIMEGDTLEIFTAWQGCITLRRCPDEI